MMKDPWCHFEHGEKSLPVDVIHIVMDRYIVQGDMNGGQL
jgi:hypothetical protein